MRESQAESVTMLMAKVSMSTSGVSAFSKQRLVRIESAPTATGRRAAASSSEYHQGEAAVSKGQREELDPFQVVLRGLGQLVDGYRRASDLDRGIPREAVSDSQAADAGDVVDVGGDVGEQQGLAPVGRDELWIPRGG